MNNKLPFEDAFEQRMADLPLPQEDEAWQKMKTLLEEDDRRRPLAWFNNYKLWSILVLLLLGGGLWLLLATRTSDKPKPSVSSIEQNPLSAYTTTQQNTTQPPSSSQEDIKQPGNTGTPAPSDGETSAYSTTDEPAGKPATTAPQITIVKNHPTASTAGRVSSQTPTSQTQNNTAQNIQTTNTKQSLTPSPNTTPTRTPNKLIVNAKHTRIQTPNTKWTNSQSPNNQTQNTKQNNTQTPNNKQPTLTVADIKSAITSFKKDSTPIATSLTNPEATKDFVQIDNGISTPKAIVSPKKDEPAKDTVTNTKQAKRTSASPSKKWSVSAGIGVQQPIPIGGQQTVALGYNGKSKISDYIPSVHLRLQRANKWFLLAEFNYGAPQLVKEFAYSRKTTADIATATVKTTTMHLQKTFYSEIPFSFNYYLRNNWSLGIGGMYSWLHGAIAEQETSIKNVQTQQQLVTRQVVPIKGFTDSFLYRSHTYLLLQSDYQWRRFSFGLRYSRDLQPYIRYTMPDGAILDERNWSLEFILRFQLWRSIKF